MSHASITKRVGRVSALWRYPVKSMLGEELPFLDASGRGIAGDRAFAVRTADGKLGSGKTTRRFERVDGLLRCRATLEGDAPRVELSNGATTLGEGPGVDALLSEAIGRPLSLVRERDVSHLDAAPVHLLTTASLRWLAARVGEAAVDVRRFRPNIVVETDGADLAEDAWADDGILLCGEIELRITTRTVRCVMTTLAQRDLAAAPAVLPALASDNDACLGVYADVVRGGRVAVGDEVTIVTPA